MTRAGPTTRRSVLGALAVLPGLADTVPAQADAIIADAERGAAGEPVAGNDWPDPQFCVQDANGIRRAINDALTGLTRPIAVSGHGVGSWVVVCRTTDTGELEIGDWVRFSAGVQPALAKTLLRVVAIDAGLSFTVVTEFLSGKPERSTPCVAEIVQRGAGSASGGGSVTSKDRKSVV